MAIYLGKHNALSSVRHPLKEGDRMVRMGRIPSESGFYHVTARGNGRQVIFETDNDRLTFLTLTSEAKRKHNVAVIAWCLMSNHVHLLLKDDSNQLSKMMHSLLGGYASYFNRTYGNIGHVFQDRFNSTPIESDSYLLETVRYIHNNPAKAGICAIEDYPWSSFHEYVVGSTLTDTSLVMEMCGGLVPFIEFSKSNEPTPTNLKEPRVHLPDGNASALANSVISKMHPGKTLSDIKTLPKNQRTACLIQLRKAGLSVRQIQSITGIGTRLIKEATIGRWRD